MDFTKQSPVILSFCPGIRGIERGLERVFREVRTATFVEVETFIVENLLAAMEAGVVAPAPIWSNLKTFDPKPFRGVIDGIIGGYPCQPFSVAGNRGGEDDPRHLWPFIRRHIEVIQPRWCFFENVAGHLTLGFDVVKRELEEMGYWVEAGIYTAEEVGAPHRRERLFILAERCSSDWTDEELADTSSARDEVRLSRQNERKEGFSGITNNNSTKHRFPAGQGVYQHEWEEPRTIESSLEHTINGYNFTEDLHRAIGNSVVEQTAELAFRDLVRKMHDWFRFIN